MPEVKGLGLEDEVAEELPQYKQLIRSIGASDVPQMGIFSAQSVDATLNEWYAKGYSLFSVNVNYVRREAEFPEHWYAFYVLSKN